MWLSLQVRAARVSRSETRVCALQMLSAQLVCSLVHKGEVMELLKCLNNELKLPLANATSSRETAGVKRAQPSRSSGVLGAELLAAPGPSHRPAGGRGLGAARSRRSGTRTPPRAVPVGQAGSSAAGSAFRSCLLLLGISGCLVGVVGCLLQSAEQGCVSLQVSGTPLRSAAGILKGTWAGCAP